MRCLDLIVCPFHVYKFLAGIQAKNSKDWHWYLSWVLACPKQSVVVVSLSLFWGC